MTTEKPKEGRCGARVVDKVGLDVELDGGVHIEADVIDQIVLHTDGHTREDDPNYIDIVEYLVNGYDIVALDIDTSGPIDDYEWPDEHTDALETDDEIVRIDVDCPYEDVTHSDVDHKGFCERWPMDNGKCYNHGGGAGAPEGNLNAATHFLHANEDNYYNKVLDDEEKSIVHSLADSWIDQAPFDRDNKAMATECYRIAVDQVRLWKSHEHFAEYDFIDDFVVDYDDQGEPLTKVDENPANLPYSRLDRDNLKKLKDLGITDAQEEETNVNVSLTQKFADLDV